MKNIIKKIINDEDKKNPVLDEDITKKLNRDGYIISSSYHSDYDNVDYVSGSSTMDGNQHSFITGVTLWDSFGNPLAIASLSKPLMKNYDREAIIKVKLEF